MKIQNKKIQVHKFLVELFGRETTTFDLLAIVIGSFSVAGLTLALKWNTDISIFKLIILTILTLDIAGGVVANFTTGTTNYYAETLRKRYFFVLFHLLQPSILIWIFPNELQAILGISIVALLCSFIVLNLNKHYTQRITANSKGKISTSGTMTTCHLQAWQNWQKRLRMMLSARIHSSVSMAA
jgi:hypothetical protein